MTARLSDATRERETRAVPPPAARDRDARPAAAALARRPGAPARPRPAADTLFTDGVVERPSILGPERPAGPAAAAAAPSQAAAPAPGASATAVVAPAGGGAEAHHATAHTHLPRPSSLVTEGGREGAEEPLGGGGLTLDDLIVGAWEGLAAARSAPCPMCGGPLEPRFGSGPLPVAGRCRDCGTELS